MRTKYFLFFLVFLVIAVPLSAQSDQHIPNIMSPDVASLGKYGSYDINYYTGTPIINIPIHEINEQGVHIPIALSYDASGFIPNKNAGVVGLNWNLIAGGAITRVVKGQMDEKNNPNPGVDDQVLHNNIGYIYGMTHGFGLFDSSYIRTISFQTDFEDPVFHLPYEYNPDIFAFNFLGHSGKFFMDNNGVVQVAGDRNYKVDLSNFKGQYNFRDSIGKNLGSLQQLNSAILSQIIMTSDDGYTFYFGGSLNTLEISFEGSPDYPGIPHPATGHINAWYLTKVVNPDGNQILFNYRNYTDDDLTTLKFFFNVSDGLWRQLPASFIEVKLFRNHTMITTTRDGITLPPLVNTKDDIYTSFIMESYLSEIVTKIQKVKFTYGAKDRQVRFYDTSMVVLASTNTIAKTWLRNWYTQRLERIDVTDNFQSYDHDLVQLRRFDFTYNYFGRRMFLSSVRENLQNAYHVTYSHTNDLPDPLTRGIDVWGFYNGRDNNTSLVVPPVAGSAEYVSNLAATGAYRLADTAYTSYGLLDKIVYPTGGETKFVFESQKYGKVLKRKVSSGILPVWKDTAGVAGGARIKQIINYPGDTTTFRYITDYNLNVNNSSSGLLVDDGIYYLEYRNSEGFLHYDLSDNNIAKAASYSEPPIVYKEVVLINSSGGYTKYKFTNHETNPDVYYLGNDSYKITPETSTSSFNNQMKRLYIYSSKEQERGKPLRTEVYNSSNILLKSLDYKYNTNNQKENARTIGVVQLAGYQIDYFHPVNSLIQSYALYYYQNEVTRITEKNFVAGSADQIVTNKYFTYKSNTSHLIQDEKSIGSNGDTIINRYKYPVDFSTQQPYIAMVNDKNILTPVILDEEYRRSATAPERFVGARKVNYS